MKTPTLQISNNPLLFIPNHEQRPVNPMHVKRVASSMTKHGFLPSKPIQCYRRPDRKLVIVDGHHRYEAAKSLGLDFYYVVESEAAQGAMADVQLGFSWKPNDFIRQYSMRGSKDYATLAQYISRGLPCMIAISLLSGESAGSSNARKLIPSGAFKVKSTDHAEKILSLMEDNQTTKVFHHSNFIKALSLCLWLKQFDFQTFKKRAEANWHMIPNCSNVPDFLSAIEEVYNFRSQLKQPISHLARAAAKSRSCVKTK